VARYRLKFPLQEVDLLVGETIIGRSPACTVTIEDPLVSREHAVVRVTEDHAIFEDLGSRNGSRINGEVVRVPTTLADGDTIQIGKHEIQFFEVPAGRQLANNPTGFLRNCSKCGMPYAADAGACPSCGSTEYVDDTTGVDGEVHQTWALGFFVEMLERSIALGREADADKTVRRAVTLVDERLDAGDAIERKHLDGLADAALRVLSGEKRVAFIAWIFGVYERLDSVAPRQLVEAVSTWPPIEMATLKQPLGKLLSRFSSRPPDMTPDELAALQGLEALRTRLRGVR
jgi:hypothetical protein